MVPRLSMGLEVANKTIAMGSATALAPLEAAVESHHTAIGSTDGSCVASVADFEATVEVDFTSDLFTKPPQGASSAKGLGVAGETTAVGSAMDDKDHGG